MLDHHGEQRRSVLIGSSVHNERIECLWRDSHRCVTSIYYKLFYYMEYHNLLDSIDELHLYSLHYVFLPRINRSLKNFQDAWNFHGLRTEGNNTPNQLFTMGALQLRHSGMAALDFFDSVTDDYGIEEDGIAPDSDDQEVTIPRISIELTDMQLLQLQQTVNPLQEMDDYGISLYTQTVQLLRSWNIQ